MWYDPFCSSKNVIYFDLLMTDSMEQSPSSEVNSHSARQENLHLLWNPKVHYHVHNGTQILKPCVTFRNKLLFLRLGIIGLSPNPHAGGLPLAGCQRLLIQYIRIL